MLWQSWQSKPQTTKLPAYPYQAKYNISISVLCWPNQLCIAAFEGNVFIKPEISANNRSLISSSLILLSLNPWYNLGKYGLGREASKRSQTIIYHSSNHSLSFLETTPMRNRLHLVPQNLCNFLPPRVHAQLCSHTENLGGTLTPVTVSQICSIHNANLQNQCVNLRFPCLLIIATAPVSPSKLK